MAVKLAGCVIANSDGQILLIHRNNGKFNHWELPGGKVEAGESREAAAVRELQEELGVTVKIVKELGGCGFTDKNGDFDYSWFQAVIVGGEPRLGEPDVFDDFGYFGVDEMNSIALSGNMQKLSPKLLSGEVTLINAS